MAIFKENSKPLLRYTIGRVSKSGHEILSESIRLAKKVYPEFDIAICYNNLTEDEIKLLPKDGQKFSQEGITPDFNFEDEGSGRVRNFFWKLIPSRLRMQSHELWIDNDIVINRRIPGVDRWLASSTGLISRGFNRDYGIFSNDPELLKQDPYCAGFFGLPPGFDLTKEISNLCDGKILCGFDEQGLVAKIISNFNDRIVLDHNEMVLLSERWKPNYSFWFPPGMHFARSNRFDDHISWNMYKLSTTP